MSMKYMKQINIFLAIAFVLGSVFLGAVKAQALYIMSPGIPEEQLYLYPGYVGPIIPAQPTSGPTTAPIIPNLYPTYTPPTYTAPVVNQPVVQSTQVTYSQPVVTYSQPVVTYSQPVTTPVVQTTQPTQTTTQVRGSIIRTPTVNGITSTVNTTGVSANSNVPGVCSGDTVNYTLNYANTTGATINNAMVIVTMPAEIDFKSSTAATNYNERNRTVTLFVGTLTKGQTGVVYLQGTANSMVNGTGTIMTRVDFTFTKATGATETTTSYVIHSGTNCGSALGANVLGAGFLPTSFGGWLLIAVLLCGIIFIVRKFFGKESGHAHGGHMEHQAH